jgi:vitamin B12 transporter
MENKKLTTSLVAGLLLATNLYSNDLSSITVTSATKSEQSIKDVTSNVEVITNVEIEERNFITVSEALNTIVGLDIVNSGGLGQLDSLFIRGISSSRVLILIDGIRYNEPAGLSGAPLSQLNMADVERIEVIKGAQSGIWGADASGGVVNIITSKANTGFHGTLNAEYGSFDTRKLGSTLSYKNDIGFIKINGNRVDTDGFSAAEPTKSSADYGKRGDDLSWEEDGYTNNTYNFQAGLYLSEKDELNVSYKKIDAEYEYDGGAEIDDSSSKAKLDHYFKSANYIHKSNNYIVKANIQQAKFNRMQSTSSYSFGAKSLVNEFSLLTDIDYMDKSNLVLGLNKQNFEDIDNSYTYNIKAAFLSNSNSFENLVFSQTLRYDNNSTFDEKVTGKIGVKYNFTNDFSSSGNYGTAYNAPSLSNLSYTSTLKPETTTSYDINIEYKGLKVTYFNNKIEDMISYISGSWPNTAYENLDGESVLKGYEFSYKKDILDDTLLSLNYTRLSAKNSDREDLARRAENEVNVSVDYYGFDKFHINLNANYIGERYNNDNNTGEQTGKYTVWNSVINYDVNRNLSVYLKLDNIFNKYYQEVDGYATAQRSAYVGLKYSF